MAVQYLLVLSLTLSSIDASSVIQNRNVQNRNVQNRNFCNRQAYWRQLHSGQDSMVAMNLICNSTTSDKLNSDACYGCFSRAIYNAQESMFQDIIACTETYLQSSIYQTCVDELTNGSITVTQQMEKGQCSAESIAFCNFEKCVRRIDMKRLVRECIEEVRAMSSSQADVDEVAVYVNTTACILTRIRCRTIGKVNQYQMNGWNEKQNALLITAENDLHEVQLPHGITTLACGNGAIRIGVAKWGGENC